jgi:tetratricopeptide (TPR) repeat protein
LNFRILTSLVLGISSCVAYANISTPDDADKHEAAIQAVVSDFNDNKIDAALAKLQKLQQAMPDDPSVLNLLGSAYSRKKDYAAAEEYFRKALDEIGDYFPAAFNLGEILFLQKKYTESRDYFQKLRTKDSGNELLQYKIALCDILTGEDDRAKKSMNLIKYPGDSPAWYYAQAAWEFKHSNAKKGREYIRVAKSIFGSKTALFDETFANLNFK